MAKAKAKNKCDCVSKLNKLLEEKNTILNFNLMSPEQVFIATNIIVKKRGKKAVAVIATYCPFCGEKYKSID